MTNRIPLDAMTSDQLDRLYTRLERAESAVRRVRRYVIRSVMTGFAVARVDAAANRYARQISADPMYASVAQDLRCLLGDAWDVA